MERRLAQEAAQTRHEVSELLGGDGAVRALRADFAPPPAASPPAQDFASVSAAQLSNLWSSAVQWVDASSRMLEGLARARFVGGATGQSQDSAGPPTDR